MRHGIDVKALAAELAVARRQWTRRATRTENLLDAIRRRHGMGWTLDAAIVLAWSEQIDGEYLDDDDAVLTAALARYRNGEPVASAIAFGREDVRSGIQIERGGER